MSEYLLLKWGTLKGWSNVTSEATINALKAYHDAGSVSMSSMTQRDNDAQKKALCDVIDAVIAAGGEVQNDWSGETYPTADAAKAYVLSYDLK